LWEVGVYQLFKAGRLLGYRIGPRRGSIRISEEWLLAYLESCRVEENELVASVPRQRQQKMTKAATAGLDSRFFDV
jgi:hypothetical protein